MRGVHEDQEIVLAEDAWPLVYEQHGKEFSMNKLPIDKHAVEDVFAQPTKTNNRIVGAASRTTSLVLYLGRKLRITATGPLAVISVSVVSTLAIIAVIVTNLPVA